MGHDRVHTMRIQLTVAPMRYEDRQGELWWRMRKQAEEIERRSNIPTSLPLTLMTAFPAPLT